MKVAIAWYGAEGQVNYRYYMSRGHDVTIVTPQVAAQYPLPDGAKSIVGEDAFSHLEGFDLVVRSAGIRPDSLKTNGKIWSATNEFFAQCPAPIIGVTGTKGKGTTSSLIASILQAAGKTVHLVGNIGVPALEVLPSIRQEDIVVFEMSSFQLWDLEKSPHVAVVLMVEPDHQDVHLDMDEYVTAKANIRRYQGLDDVCIYHPTNEYSKRIAMTGDWPEDEQERTQWQETAGRYGIPDDGMVYVKENTFFVQSQQICSTDVMQIPGVHNLENACAAISAARVYTVDNDAIEQGLRNFSGLPHRLKFIRELDGVHYYDDNYSSAPGAAIAAIRAFSQPEIIIMGGYNKGVEFNELAKAIKEQPNIKRIILMGQTRHTLAAALDAVGRKDLYEVTDETTLQPIVERATVLAKTGDVVIMSPACASFDMFNNFSDRGDQFIKLVEGL